MEPENSYRCTGCKELLQEFQFKSHIRKCPKYDGILLRSTRKLSERLNPIELKFIIAEIDVCREEVEDKLHGTLELKKKNSSVIKIEPEINIVAFNQDIVQCQKCQKKLYSSFDVNLIFYVEECWHLFCIQCVRKFIDEEFMKNFGNIQCLLEGCNNSIMEHQLKGLLGEKKFMEMQNKAIRLMMNIVECVKCKSEYEFVSGNPRDAPKKNESGKTLNQAEMVHYAENRFICPKADCRSEQCKTCSSIPYHTGFSCEEFKKHAEMKKCRYCEEPLTEKNRSQTKFQALQDICNARDCQNLSERACTRKLECGHSCCGYRGEEECLPCLREECCQDKPELNGQNTEEYCNICFIEGLGASPCVRSTCGHIFHEKCLKKRFEVRWLTPRIYLNFCLCPLCKKWLNLAADSILAPQIKKNLDLYAKLQTMSLDRLKFEECDKDEKLKDPNSPYFQKPNEYAMAIYAYFECFKCKNPYFGGRKSCAQAMNEPRDAGSFKAEELICPNCCEIPIEDCPKHGKDFIEFKCKFCCSISQWFCWGNTHFCEPCHKKQCNGDYVSKYTKEQLPKCEGPGKCPVGGNHNGNGEEKTLGCAICRNFKENNKNF